MTPLSSRATWLFTTLYWTFAMSSQTAGLEFIREHKPLREALALHINGVSYHKASDRAELNQVNYGFGVGYYLGTIESGWSLIDDAEVSAEAEFYSDSFSSFAYLGGVTLQKQLTTYLDYGINIGFIHEDHLVDDIGLCLVPYIFPYLETSFDTAINARLTIIPPVGNKGVLALQLIARF